MSKQLDAGQYASPKGVIATTHVPNVVALGEGTSKPTDATAGFSPGCLFLVRGDGLYINNGTVLSCLFVKQNGLGALKVSYGQATTVTASDTIVTGLATVVSAVANLDSDPTTDPEIAVASIGDQAGTPAAGSILIKTWKTFGGTPAAATVFTKKVNWIAIGT